jgi:acyl-CoA thioester hydrolase
VSDVRNYHRSKLRIPFRDVDSWGLVWHGHYFSYVDQARIELMRRFNVPFSEFPAMGFLMPLVQVNMDLRAPGRADEPVVVEVALLRVRGAMVDTHFRIVRDDGKEDQALAKGTTRQVFTRTDGGLLYHIPESVAPGFDSLTAYATGAS